MVFCSATAYGDHVVLPAELYALRRRERAETLKQADARYALVSNARLVAFIAVIVCGWFGLKGGASLAFLYASAPLAAFAALVVWHDRVSQRREAAQRAVDFYERGLSHFDGSWMGKGVQGAAPVGHAYAPDLDIFGAGSLYELLCSAQTREGRARLAEWLEAPAPIAEARARQAAAAEIMPDLDLREALNEHGAGSDASLDVATLQAWAKDPARLTASWLGFVLWPVTLLSSGTLILWLATDFIPSWPFFATLPFVIALERFASRDVAAITQRVSRPLKELKALQSILLSIEGRTFTSPWLAERVAKMKPQGARASARIGQLVRLVEWYDSRRNQLFAPFAYAALWSLHFARAIDRWRLAYGDVASQWLGLVGDIEALASLSAYAFEQADSVFPELVDGPQLIEGEALGHPLLPANKCVRNDVALGSAPQLYVVSGSNMSGKSTYMRTIGTNVVLALAGAPVRAKRLRLSYLQIGASLRVQDSLQEGASRFYAEIRRLKQVMDLSTTPLLFLLDEILAGTNSHDRRVGTEAVLKTLVQRGAIGLVTTHDLALTEIATTLGGRARNVHFEDHMEGDKLVFDYRMRDGVVEKSNAIALMRAVGLEV